MFNRAILHLDLDAFFASVECLKNSQLKGKPLIIGGIGGRGVVTSCSYEARRFGIRAAMPMKMARRLCPDATVLRGDMDSYLKQSALITDIIAEQAPAFEKASIDEFYLDLTGMDKYFGCWKWSKELRELILKESGLPLSIGLSINKLVSKVGAGEAKPNGAQLVETGSEKNFLAPLPTQKLPGLGKKTCQKLSLMGVRKVQTLAQIPPPLLERAFGKAGISMWKKANGIDNRPIEPYHEKQSLSSEWTFQEDTIDVALLKRRLAAQVAHLAFDLRQRQQLTACITVKIRYTDYNTYTRQKRIAYTASDKTLTAYAHQLFDKLFERRQLIRLVGVKFSQLVHGNYQVELFEDTPKEIQLLQAMDKIRKRFGKKAIVKL